jgi:hypothetical protein
MEHTSLACELPRRDAAAQGHNEDVSATVTGAAASFGYAVLAAAVLAMMGGRFQTRRAGSAD